MSTVHIVGAGIAGLAAATSLIAAGRRVALHESAGHAGGRCRSFFDETLDRNIDNGNHLLLSGNVAVMDYLRRIGAEDQLTGPDRAAFPFVDLSDGTRWTVEPNAGPIPWWILLSTRRIPGTSVFDHFSALDLANANASATVAEAVGGEGALFRRFWEPLAVAVLNTPAEKGAATLLWRVVRETFGRGGRACLPLIAREGLSQTFIEPALRFLEANGAEIAFNRRLRAVEREGDAVTALDFGDDRLALDSDDSVVLAVPPAAAISLLPEVEAPQENHAIVNAHFRLEGAPAAVIGGMPFLGLVGGVAQWLFVRGDIVSITVSAADALAEESAERIAELTWADVAVALDLPASPIPPCRVVKERRATFAQTPAAEMRRPGPRSPLGNLFLAGDWTNTGLPATIEGAIRSGEAAARAVAT